jgi:hypothetical protein
MATNNKIKFPFWVTPKTMETVKEMYKDDDCRSQSEFIEKAINAYVGYLRADNSPGMLPNYMISTMKAIVDSSDTRMCRMMFKLAVEMAIMANILAANSEIKEESLSTLRQSCIDEVKRINGTLGFEDAYYWQKG